MSNVIELQAEERSRVGKGAAREERRKGLIPAVIYGNKQPPEPITLEYRTVYQQVQTGQFLSTVYLLNVNGKKIRVIPKDIQLDPVRDFPMHVDFLRVKKDAVVTVEVSVHFLNEDKCPGLKQGGVLNVVRHNIELECPADSIPDSIEIDLSNANVGDTIHISNVTLPDNAKPTITDRDFTVATIAAPGGGVKDEADSAEQSDESSEE
ncbi:MAG: 50S ribosomal protein L25/general stress protein Ctc [Pseudomonadota bacterium]